MSNQTVPKPKSSTSRRPSPKGTARATSVRRQPARYHGVRDGKPLIFGWGGHLTRIQKNRIQQRAAYSFLGAILAVIIIVFAFGVLQQNVIIPNQSIVSVNGKNITQDTYRKYLAYISQVLWSKVQGELKQQAALQTAVKNGDPNATAQINIVTSQITTDESNYSSTQLTTQAASDLVEDQLIVAGIAHFEKVDPASKAQLNISSADVTKAVNAFKSAFPANESVSDFLSKNGMSDSDLRSAATIQLRREKLQAYLSSKLVSPARQVHYRRIEVNSLALANKLADELKKGTGTWETLAKQNDLDATGKDNGGDAGWLAPGTGDAAIENWLLAPGRQVNQIGVIKDASGTFDVLEALAFDPSRVVDASLLSAAKSNALDHWLSGAKADPTNHVGTPNSTMMQDSRNMPRLPDLNAQLPVQTPPGGVPSVPNP
ncbi:MAG TPA: peptidylprolyl isomerase [Ktedonobacterales bacterium]